MKPLKFDANKKIAVVMAVCGLLGTVLLMIVQKPHAAGEFLKCAIPLMTGGLTGAVLYLLHLYTARVTVTEEGVCIENRRKGIKLTLAWARFSYLYKIEMSTISIVYPFFLLTDKPLDKRTQKEVYEKCVKNRETPWVHEGCLLMDAYHNGTEIMKRLPEHIRIMPWSECAHF